MNICHTYVYICMVVCMCMWKDEVLATVSTVKYDAMWNWTMLVFTLFFFVSPRYSFVSPPSTDKWMSTPALFTLRDRNLSALLAKTSQNRRKIGVYGSPCRQIEVMNGIEMPLVGIRSNVDIEHSYVLHGQTILFTCAS